jgi:propionate CoA-transferase
MASQTEKIDRADPDPRHGIERRIRMNLIETMKTCGHMAAFFATHTRRDLDYCPKGLAPSIFITAEKAASLIPDGATVISAGMAGHARCSIFFWAIKDVHQRTKSPSGLTWITVSAQGGRGKHPGTLEELAVPGLVSEYICGHVETARAILEMGERREIEIHILPQGEITEILCAQADGLTTVASGTGAGTFLDPETGGGTAITPHSRKSYVYRNGNRLEYSLPKIDVALFNAPYADRVGNIYFRNASAITEISEAAQAARRNNGKVMAAVSGIVDRDEAAIGLPARFVDHIVVNPWNEQTATVRQKNFWPMFTEGAAEDIGLSLAKLKTINTLAGAAPKRGPVEDALARMASSLFVQEARKGSSVNLGTGLPEEVGRLLYEGGLYNDLTFSTETGVYGGLPTPGVFFGGAINPLKIRSSAWIFNHYKTHLDITVLGMLQADSMGNVNVSRRGPGVTGTVGPGGFMNIADCAKTIIFIGSWMAKADFRLKNGKLHIRKKGIPKFVDRLHEVTFNAQEALKKGKRIFYVTTVGIFRLTGAGLEMIRIMPGVDFERDVVATSTARLRVSDRLETVPESIVTGKGFRLGWE